MRRVKKTTNEQFELLKAEMALHPAAARGYGMGAQRLVVDAEWKDIVEKLNALGPPERTMPEWKKVWSDLRLRSIKRLSEEFAPKPKKIKKKKGLKTFNTSDSIYASNDQQNNEHYSHTYTHMNEDTHHNDIVDDSYDNPLEEEHEDLKLPKTEKHFFDSNHDANNSYDINSLEEEEYDNFNSNNSSRNNDNSDCPSPRNTVETHFSQDKQHNSLEKTLSSIELQMRNQSEMMEQLTKITTNLVTVMERQVTCLEKQNSIMEKQLKAHACHSMMIRRQEARRKIQSKRKVKGEGQGKL